MDVSIDRYNLSSGFHTNSGTTSGTPTSRNSKRKLDYQTVPKSLDMNSFDLSSLSDELPPNTGPAGSVPVTSTNGANSSKNLSHVPCKFHRQGICQAGSSCPFSHNLNGTLGADKLPCKYFQKGNCKFGLRCALAHFLPDGTKINSRSYMSSRNDRKSNNYNNSNGYGNFGGNGGNNNTDHSNNNSHPPTSAPQPVGGGNGGTISTPVSTTTRGSGSAPGRSYASALDHGTDPIDISNYAQSITPPNKPVANFLNYPGAKLSAGNLNSAGSGFYSNGKQNMTESSSNSFQSGPSYQNNFMSSISGSFGNASAGSTMTPNSFLAANIGTAQSNGGSKEIFRSESTETSPLGGSLLQSTSSPPRGSSQYQYQPSSQHSSFFSQKQFIHSPSNVSLNINPGASFSHSFTAGSRLPTHESFSSYLNSSDIHESAILDDDPSKDDFFEEDYVPASLGDIILTPQELQRRDSRSQSGTLLVRPNITIPHNKEADGDQSLDDQFHDHDDNDTSKLSNDDVFLME